MQWFPGLLSSGDYFTLINIISTLFCCFTVIPFTLQTTMCLLCKLLSHLVIHLWHLVLNEWIPYHHWFCKIKDDVHKLPSIPYMTWINTLLQVETIANNASSVTSYVLRIMPISSTKLYLFESWWKINIRISTYNNIAM